MNVPADRRVTRTETDADLARRKKRFPSWLLSYEIYIIIIIAAVLRFYSLNTTEFDGDQADFFYLARDAVVHGHLMATSTTASIGVYNPPTFIYTLMVSAVFSSSPIAGAIENAIITILGVFFTYYFTRRYYGRVAATIASGLFAVTSGSLFYSRFIWNPNMSLGFVPLFFILLFRGVVDRKPGWLFPAIFLYGLLCGWHGSALLLGVPFAVALLLAPKTIRWRDIVLGGLSLIVLYAPYFLWLIATHFAVFSRVSDIGSIPSYVDNQSWLFYLHFIIPYDLPFTNRLALLYNWQGFFNWLVTVMACLVIAAILCALLLVLFLGTERTEAKASSVFNAWWRNILKLRASPYRCGLLVLLFWQLVPLLMLIKHGFLYPHYFLFLLPGPFILIGWFIASVAKWLRAHTGRYRFVAPVLYVFTSLVLLLQGVAGAASVLDLSRGNFDDHQLSSPYYNDFASLQNAVTKANQLAQQYHAGRIVMLANSNLGANEQIVNGKRCIQGPNHLICQDTYWYSLSTRSVFRYFMDQLQVSSTVVDDTCLLLPGPSTGPMVVLVPPYESSIDAFFASNYIHVVRSETSNRLGGDPFHIYVVDPLPEAKAQTTFSSMIQFVDTQKEDLQQEVFTAVRWNVLQTAPAGDRVVYNYQFTYTSSGNAAPLPPQNCNFTNVHAGEQLVTLVPLGNVQDSLSVQVRHASTTPYIIKVQSIPILPAFDTFQQNVTPFEPLRTSDGHETVTISLNAS